MIAQLKGFILEVTPEHAVLDVNGVGYELVCSLNTLAELQADLMGGTGATAKPSKPVQVYTYTHVREDVLQLFGFATKTEKQLFTTLLKVNGIGPKMAINILSGASVDQILVMIEAEDVKALSKLPKVGKKTAEQMVLTLKGKLVIHEPEAAQKKTSATGKQLSLSHSEIHSALVNLGFRPQDVDKVVSQLPKEIDLQEGIRQGLSALSGA
ncbi:MAG: Holliday junction branch migration protein RuvA [Pseudobdellovibrionaceae bacterium]